MIGTDKIHSMLKVALDLNLGDQADAVFLGSESGLTRFANSTIHQNVAETQSKVYFRVAIGKKLGVASTNSFTGADLKRAYKSAAKIAKVQRENPHFVTLPKPAAYPNIDTFFDGTAKFTPRQRAMKVKSIIDRAGRKNCTVAGSLSSGSGELAVVNTLGVNAYQRISSSSVNVIAMGATSSGYAEGLSRNVEDLDFRAIAGRAVDRAVRCANPVEMPPGEYEVILEPAAVASLIEWVNYIGFGSKPFQENTSFMAGRLGEKITGDAVTIYDDGTDPTAIAFPFDFEGVPKRKVELITNGVAKGVVYDSITAVRGGCESTGHALTPDASGEGGLALNVFVQAGKSSLPEMIANVENGLLVTRFHYINGFIDTPHAVLTGMTRDGLMQIKKGRLKGGVKNLRFTDSILRAFGSVKALSAERQLINAWWDSLGCISAPAMHLGSFRFTGQTDF
ncbi:MAG: TldD/PmbA family protein [candidate division Zixibacteria bacterium]|nr:TldD/PmbA family protein [candidate division Zixibacteria bacterium]